MSATWLPIGLVHRHRISRWKRVCGRRGWWRFLYLRGFYKDESRPLGVNNVVFPAVGMPHVLVGMQGLCAVEPNIGTPASVEPLSGK
ncbi:hypothetical protein HZ997_00005 [Marinobacter salsuginis]|nr:hypothetical protein [Marinobacter salsuginis]QTN41829.1 hypothetical protein HZ997_00005 [Marinobacter salsuginis]